MSTELMAGLVFLGTFILLGLGVHIGLVLAFAGVIGSYLIVGDFSVIVGLLKTNLFYGVAIYDLSVVPLFILMGEFCYAGGISGTAFDAINKWVGKIRGGLAIATTWACAAFGAVSGSSVATASVFTKVAYPEMVKAGYDKYFAAGVIAAGATLDMLIPPSLYMVVFGIVAQVSISRLLIAGFIPGILVMVFLSITIYIRAIRNPKLAPPLKKIFTMRQKVGGTVRAWPIVLLAMIIIVGIYSGVFTPTEAAAVGSFAALVITVGQRKLSFVNFRHALAEAAYTSAMLSLLVIGATVFSRLMTLSGLPVWFGEVIRNSGLSAIWVILIMLVVYCIFDIFIDALSIMFLTLPIFAPILSSLGVNLVWFGVLTCTVLNLCQITPPFGMTVFTVKAVAGPDVKIEGVFKGAAFGIWAMLVSLVILIIFPQISLVLPDLMMGGR